MRLPHSALSSKMFFRYSFIKKKIPFVLLFVVTVVYLYPSGPSESIIVIKKEDILSKLHVETAQNFSTYSVFECEYRDTVLDDTVLTPHLGDVDLTDGHRMKEGGGGEHMPSDCKPKYSVALVVPYRDKVEQLRGFLVYMHNFLQNQKLHYRIYVIEQVDNRPFSKTKLLNIGATIAMKAGFPCLILHDVDLLPLRPANLYACTESPRLMFYSKVPYRIILSYSISRSALAITAKQFMLINGLTNKNFDINIENENLKYRLATHNLKLCQYEPEINQYYLIEDSGPLQWDDKSHPQVISKKTIEGDGLSSLEYKEAATVMHPLFTHIMVDLAKQYK